MITNFTVNPEYKESGDGHLQNFVLAVIIMGHFAYCCPRVGNASTEVHTFIIESFPSLYQLGSHFFVSARSGGIDVIRIDKGLGTNFLSY